MTIADLLTKGILIQSAISLIVVVTFAIEILEGSPIDPDLRALLYIVIGYYFGVTTQYVIHKLNGSG